MKATEVKYSKRFNLGDYEHEEFSITLAMGETQNAVEALKAAKDVVHAAHNGDESSLATQNPKVENLPEKKSKKPKSEIGPDPKKPKSAKKAEKEEEEDEESEEEIEEIDEEGSEEDENDDESESEEESEQEEVEEKPKRSGKSKSTTYDRTNDLHKNLVGKMLTHYFPEWRTKLKETAVQASKKMQGKDFLNKDGIILKTFEDEFVKMMKKKK